MSKLTLGKLGTVVKAKWPTDSPPHTISVALKADHKPGETPVNSFPVGSLTASSDLFALTIHFEPGRSTVKDIEKVIADSTVLIEVVEFSKMPTSVLVSGDAFEPALILAPARRLEADELTAARARDERIRRELERDAMLRDAPRGPGPAPFESPPALPEPMDRRPESDDLAADIGDSLPFLPATGLDE